MDTVSQGCVAKRDGDVAHRLTEGAALSNTENPETNSEAQVQRDGSLTKPAALSASGPRESQQVERLDSEGGGDVEPLSCAASIVNSSSVSRLCEACWEERKSFDVIRLPCRHNYCRGCLEDIYRASMTDESRYPPRCCRQAIPITLVQPFVSSQLVQDFKKKKIEFETPNRTYCWSLKCSALICAQNIRGEVATCLDCGSRTCTICKVAAHKGDCPNDTALQQLLRSAAKNGWQRCYSCSRVVELSYGCSHITCRCGAQFCYLCGLRWKTCKCELSNGNRLLARADQIVDPDPEPEPEDEPEPLVVLPALPDIPQPLAELRSSLYQVSPTISSGHSDIIGRSFDLPDSALYSSRPNHTDGISSTMDPLSGDGSPLPWEVGIGQPESGVSAPLSMEVSRHTGRATEIPLNYSPTPLGQSLRNNRKSTVQQNGRVVREASVAHQQRVPAMSGVYDCLPNVDRSHSYGSIEVDNTPREHPLYLKATPGSDGLYHCPWEGKDPACNHRPDKLKCNYDKFVDSHLKPYRCKVRACENARFSSTACLLRHEREAHAMHSHGEKPYLCKFEGCDRRVLGNGFPRHWNLCDHMRRVHNHSPSPLGPAKPSRGSKKRKNSTEESRSSKKSPTTASASVEKQRAPVRSMSLSEQYQQGHQQLISEMMEIPDLGDVEAAEQKIEKANQLLEQMARATQRMRSGPKMERTISQQSS